MWINFGEGFLLVYAINDKDSFDVIKVKRDRIIKGKHGEIPPMILVGNKQDLAQNRKIPYEEAKELADSWGIEYIETSAKTNLNCRQPFEKLATLISSSKTKAKGGCCCYIY